jgi:hypothetical protein
MIKNSLLTLLIAGLLSCNQSTTKQTGADTSKTGAADTSLTDRSIVKDSAANDLISADTSTTNPVSADKLITPGKGIGHIMIGEDVENAIKILGKPDSSDAAMGSSLMVWFAKHDTKGYRTSVYSHHNYNGKNDAVSNIQKVLVNSPWFKTADHLGVGSTTDAIKKNYNLKATTTYTAGGNKIQVYTDTDKGISFEIDEITHKCVAIVVHKTHETAGSYLNMH